MKPAPGAPSPDDILLRMQDERVPLRAHLPGDADLVCSACDRVLVRHDAAAPPDVQSEDEVAHCFCGDHDAQARFQCVCGARNAPP